MLVEREEDEYAITGIERKGEPVQRIYAGTVSGSFARSAQSTGLNSGAVTELTRLLEKNSIFAATAVAAIIFRCWSSPT